jgi:hypothetical protein
MNDSHEVRLRLLGRRPHAGIRTLFKGGYEPRQFSDMHSAVAFARTEAAKISQPALLEVVDKRTDEVKLRIEVDARGQTIESPPHVVWS